MKMNLTEAKIILKKNGYLLEDKYMDDMDKELDDIVYNTPKRNTKPITVDYIDSDNYEDYIGKYVNVTEDVDLSSLHLKKLPIRFGTVGGYFNCNINNLTSLEGAPKKVGGSFYCMNNKLTSLEGAPKKVGGLFNCASNELTSLKGAPNEVGGGFICADNELTSLEGAPKKVVGVFNCNINNLTSLEGAPKEIGDDFYCIKNNVKFTENDVRKVSNVDGEIIV